MALAEVGREAERLANTAHGLVDVLLFGVTALALERDVDLLALDQSVTADDTDRLAVCQHVEQRRLTGTTRSISAVI